MTLTDHEPAVLRQLRRSVEATADLSPRPPAADAADGATAAALPDVGDGASATDWDPEDADSCDDLDDFLVGGSSDSSGDAGCGWEWVRSVPLREAL